MVSVLCYQDGMLWHRLQLQGGKCPSSQAHKSRSTYRPSLSTYYVCSYKDFAEKVIRVSSIKAVTSR